MNKHDFLRTYAEVGRHRTGPRDSGPPGFQVTAAGYHRITRGQADDAFAVQDGAMDSNRRYVSESTSQKSLLRNCRLLFGGNTDKQYPQLC